MRVGVAVTHDELVEVARSWLLKRQAPPKGSYSGGRAACSLVLTDMTSASRETPDAIGWAAGLSVLVECKVSVEDFRRDKYKAFRRNPEQGAGVLRYYMTPKGLLLVDQLPENWGLVEVNDVGKTRVARRSGVFQTDRCNEVDMLLSLIRRLKVEPGEHVAIRAYSMGSRRDAGPRATVTLNEDAWLANHPVTITACDEGGYFAEISELPGCMSQGETLEEVWENVMDAKRCWLEAARCPEPDSQRSAAP